MLGGLADSWVQTVLTTIGITLLTLLATDLWGAIKRTIRRRFRVQRSDNPGSTAE